MKLLKNLFCKTEIDKLSKENEELKAKLLEKQEQINKTNAYYKRLMYNKKQKK